MSARDPSTFAPLPTMADLERLGPRRAGLFLDDCSAVRTQGLYAPGAAFDPNTGAMDAGVVRAIVNECDVLDRLRLAYYATQPQEERELEAARQIAAAHQLILQARVSERELFARLTLGRSDVSVEVPE